MKRLIERLRNRARELKSESEVLLVAYRDKRTPMAAKILIWVTIGYLLSPIDLIPDFIPILGLLDDLIIVPALIALSIRLIPAAVMDDARKIVLLRPNLPKKKSWLFAALIILVWVTVLYFVWRLLAGFFGQR